MTNTKQNNHGKITQLLSETPLRTKNIHNNFKNIFVVFPLKIIYQKK